MSRHPTADTGDLAPHVAEERVELLRQQCMSAMQLFIALEIASLTGAQACQLLCDQVENLRFSDAAQLPDEVCRRSREAGARR